MKDLYPGLRVSQAEKEDIFETSMTNTEWMRYRITGGLALPDRYASVQERRFREQARNRYKKFEPHISRPIPIHEIMDFETYVERSQDAMRQIGEKLQDSEKRPDIQTVSSQMRSIEIASIQHHVQMDSDPRGTRIREQAQRVADLTVKQLQDSQLGAQDRAELIKTLNHARLISNTVLGAQQIGQEQMRLIETVDTETIALIWADAEEQELGKNMFMLVNKSKEFLNLIDTDERVNHHLILADGLTSHISNRLHEDDEAGILMDEREWMDVWLDGAKRREKLDTTKYQQVADRYVVTLHQSLRGPISHRECVKLLDTVIHTYRPFKGMEFTPPDHILPFLKMVYRRKVSSLSPDGHEKLIVTQLKELCQMFQIDFRNVTGESEED